MKSKILWISALIAVLCPIASANTSVTIPDDYENDIGASDGPTDDSWFAKLGSWFWHTLQEFMDWSLYMFSALMTQLLSLIPSLNVSTSTVATYVNVVNAWVPLDFGLSLFTSFLAIESVVLIIRIIIKLIPTIG